MERTVPRFHDCGAKDSQFIYRSVFVLLRYTVVSNVLLLRITNTSKNEFDYFLHSRAVNCIFG